MKHDERFETLLNEANVNFEGWDFSYIAERMKEFPLPWDYTNQVKRYLDDATALLDMGTGGGEYLSTLQPLPRITCATEGYEPNIKIAKETLEPLGITVYPVSGSDVLPIDDAAFDLVINRHESFSGCELNRIMKPGGFFITQQVGGLNDADLNLLFGAKQSEYLNWSLESALKDVKSNGFVILKSKDCITKTRFYDIGALVYYLKCIPWQIEDFTVDRYYEQLRNIHTTIEEDGYIDIICHRFLIVGQKNN